MLCTSCHMAQALARRGCWGELSESKLNFLLLLTSLVSPIHDSLFQHVNLPGWEGGEALRDANWTDTLTNRRSWRGSCLHIWESWEAGPASLGEKDGSPSFCPSWPCLSVFHTSGPPVLCLEVTLMAGCISWGWSPRSVSDRPTLPSSGM